jgi:hypothetical protein
MYVDTGLLQPSTTFRVKNKTLNFYEKKHYHWYITNYLTKTFCINLSMDTFLLSQPSPPIPQANGSTPHSGLCTEVRISINVLRKEIFHFSAK